MGMLIDFTVEQLILDISIAALSDAPFYRKMSHSSWVLKSVGA